MSQHICGTCTKEFATEQEYLDHTCTTGFNPKQAEHLGADFVAVSERAVARGAKRKELEASGATPEVAQVEAKKYVAETMPVVK